MRILLIGPGAIGGYYAAKLIRAGADLTILARGKSYQAIRKRGIFVKSYEGSFHVRPKVVRNLRDISPFDLIILCVKSYDTEAVLRKMRPVVGSRTVILSLQNGVDNERKIATVFGRRKVLGGISFISSEVLRPGVIHHTGKGTVTIGELDHKKTKRLQAITKIFLKAGISTILSRHIQKDLWKKFSWNVGFNQVCTILRSSPGEVVSNEAGILLVRGAMEEVIAVAREKGIPVSRKVILGHLHWSRTAKSRYTPTSMEQDFQKGRNTEYEAFAGTVVREGKRLKVPTPVNEVIYQILKFLSERCLKSQNA
ncbi:MAG: ketopantoate reductase family protein [Deltaproteobacteria bacterium]|nr:ketopantoate reductase family protein [Deltaproteobacteria bacterium]MBI4374770.1 ketopantoate reductase family protein [Deltaproteobacteria bacterium]